MSSLEIYTEALRFTESLLQQAAQNKVLNAHEINEHVNLLTQSILQSPDDFLQRQAA